MRCTWMLAASAALALSPAVWSFTPPCWTRCQPTPSSPSPPCPAPCAGRLCLTCFDSQHAHALIAQLQSESWCQRHRAIEKLGSRLHADFCRDPDVLLALIGALQCDPCWHVRRAAAWGIFGQRARTPEGLLALYVSAKLDP